MQHGAASRGGGGISPARSRPRSSPRSPPVHAGLVAAHSARESRRSRRADGGDRRTSPRSGDGDRRPGSVTHPGARYAPGIAGLRAAPHSGALRRVLAGRRGPQLCGSRSRLRKEGVRVQPSTPNGSDEVVRRGAPCAGERAARDATSAPRAGLVGARATCRAAAGIATPRTVPPRAGGRHSGDPPPARRAPVAGAPALCPSRDDMREPEGGWLSQAAASLRSAPAVREERDCPRTR
jgi:hypothetical protein